MHAIGFNSFIPQRRIFPWSDSGIISHSKNVQLFADIFMAKCTLAAQRIGAFFYHLFFFDGLNIWASVDDPYEEERASASVRNFAKVIVHFVPR